MLSKDDQRAELITKPKKRTPNKAISPIVHSNAKIQQLYNSNDKIASNVQRKSPGGASTKRSSLAKRRKKISDVSDEEKPLQATASDDAANNDEAANQAHAPADTDADAAHTITEALNEPPAIQFTESVVTQPSEHREASPPLVPTQSAPVPRPYPTNKSNLMPPPDPATIPNIPVPDETNPRFVKYYDQSAMYSRAATIVATPPATVQAQMMQPQPVQKVIVKQQQPSNVIVKNSPMHINRPVVQGVVTAGHNATVNVHSMSSRIPPKINILSQQTIKSNINFVDNKIIIKPDSKLANVLKSQKIQMLPSSNNAIKSNMIIRGTNHASPRMPINHMAVANNMVNIKMIQPVEATYHPIRHNDRNLYVLNMPHQTMGGGKISNIEKIELEPNVISDDTSIDIMAPAGRNDEYIVEEVSTYPTPQLAYAKGRQIITSATTTAPYTAHMHRKLPKGVQYTTMAPHTTVVYERPAGSGSSVATHWDANESDMHHIHMENVINDGVDYESNVIYAETLDDENITEEYVTTEEYDANGMLYPNLFIPHTLFELQLPPIYLICQFQFQFTIASFSDDNVIEMEVDSENHEGMHGMHQEGKFQHTFL